MNSWSNKSAKIHPSIPTEAAAKSFFPSDLVRMFNRSCATFVSAMIAREDVGAYESGSVDLRDDDEVELLEKGRVL